MSLYPSPSEWQMNAAYPIVYDAKPAPGHQEGLLAILRNSNLAHCHQSKQSENTDFRRKTHQLPAPSVQLPNIAYILSGLHESRPISPLDFFKHSTSPDDPMIIANRDIYQKQGCRDATDSALDTITGTLFSTDPTVFSSVCEPLSQWLAIHIWDIAIIGSQTGSPFEKKSTTYGYPSEPLPILAESISSLLLSTSLQPSALVLSLYYISRLPSYIGPDGNYCRLNDAEHRFQSAVMNVDETLHDCPVTKALYACFKLFVVGAIISNKVLDDHVFTLHTWHEVSGIPLRVLNTLEWLSLDILSHDLHLKPEQWKEWTGRLENQFHSTSWRIGNDSFRITIGCMLHKLSAASVQEAKTSIAKPLFLELEHRIHVNSEKLLYGESDQCQYDMDENGPLREEYLPKSNRDRIDEDQECDSSFQAIQSSRCSRSPAFLMPQPTVQYGPDQCAGSWPPTPLDGLSPRFAFNVDWRDPNQCQRLEFAAGMGGVSTTDSTYRYKSGFVAFGDQNRREMQW